MTSSQNLQIRVVLLLYGHSPCTMPKHTDGRFYGRLDLDPVKEYQQVIISAVKQMIEANKLLASAKNLVLQTPRTSRFYLLPTIHKENNPGRPIVSACNCPTNNIALYLDMVMSPLVCNLDTHVKDTNHALEIFRTFRFDNHDTSQCFLYTMDIKSLLHRDPAQQWSGSVKIFLGQAPRSRPTHSNTHLSSGIGAYPERRLVQQ